ncbi:MAG TPA: ComEA family DNA-binding protein [Candidatus Limnocylindrales bacterium]|nr:ComEA family DNA-binding protein [Candidatus Limnocylindrales bacterium]
MLARTPYDPSAPRPRALPGLSAFDPGRRGVKVLAIVAAVAVLVVLLIAWRSAPHEEPVPVISSSAVPAAVPAELVVAVSGQVVRPGLVRLPPGSRVADAIQAAGGPIPGVDLSTINLARKLNDGELIAVGIPAPGTDPGSPAKVNLNTATLAELDSLPGVGPVLAQRIIDHRTKRGPFRTIEDLRHVDGIGEETFARLKDLVVV